MIVASGRATMLCFRRIWGARPVFKRFLRSSGAATAVEYALLAGLISIAIIVAVSAIGSETNGLWGVVSSQVSGAINSVM